MAYRRLTFQPGVNVEATATSNRGGYSQSNLIRWRSGFIEKLGGWNKACNTPVSGICRALHYWIDLDGNSWFAPGTNSNLYVESSGLLSDITPVGFTSGKVSSGTVPYSLLIWSCDNFGQVLLASPSGGTLYAWTPPSVSTPAAAVSDAPAVMQGMFVAAQQQITIGYGCTPFGGGPANPLLVRWSDQGDYTNWTPSATNQAGSFPISRGSRIVSGLSTPLANLIFTDIDVWVMQYIGFPLVYGFNPVGLNCGLLAKNGVGVLGSAVYWMSEHGFFVYAGGGVQQIPCSVWDAVFYNLDGANQDKVTCLTNYHFSEVWWFYPSITSGTGEIDSYVKYNALENLWDYGTLERTAGTDSNQPGGPYWVDGQGFIQQQETGIDSDTQPMTGVSWQSGYLDITDGQDFPFVDQYIPDFDWSQSTSMTPEITLTLYFQNWPGDTPTTQGPFTITPSTEYITLRVRARQVAEAVEINAPGTWVRRGTPRIRWAPAGRV